MSQYTIENLYTTGVVKTPNTLLVHESHPAVLLLRDNPHLTVRAVDAIIRDGRGYMPASDKVLRYCVETLRHRSLLCMGLQ